MFADHDKVDYIYIIQQGEFETSKKSLNFTTLVNDLELSLKEDSLEPEYINDFEISDLKL